jgi:hypothetical protein
MKGKPMMTPNLRTTSRMPKSESTRVEQDAASARSGPRSVLSVALLRRRRLLHAFCWLLFLVVMPGGWTQYPFPPPPQPGALVGPTLGASLRNAAASTQTQADFVRKGASDWGRRAAWSNYRVENFQQDYANMQGQFAGLRNQFNWMGNLALQLGRPRADNAVTELDAGLNIIAELFTFLESEFNAGTLDRKTIVRTCRTFEDAMRAWQRELQKSNSWIGLAS